MQHKKAFVSHASADKDRFVREFAKDLYSKGVAAWVDEWEIYPGDSLVDKIFEEGLKAADAIIIVLSANSVDRPWVREELNASVVKHIEKGTRVIPIVLDAVDVPEALKNTVWVRIDDVDDYADELDRVVAAIYDVRPKPVLGAPPPYASPAVPHIAGLGNADVVVLKLFGDEALRQNDTLGIDTEQVWELAERQGIPREEYLDSLEILSRRGYLEPSPVIAEIPPDYTVTTHGFDTYLHEFIPKFRDVFRAIGYAIVNESALENTKICERTGQARVVVDHVLRIMHENSLIEAGFYIGGHSRVNVINAGLRRLLRES